jgi:hypothetical protein
MPHIHTGCRIARITNLFLASHLLRISSRCFTPLHASCIIALKYLYTSCTSLLYQIHISWLQSSLGYICFCYTCIHRLEDQLNRVVSDSPRRSNKRERSPSPRANSRAHAPARKGRKQSRSPTRATAPPTAPDPKRRRTTNPLFQSGAAQITALSACTICLGRHAHNVYACNSQKLWDGSVAHCQKNEIGRLINPAGTILCSDWQRVLGCSVTTHDSKHECSGCGKPTHGAQKCPRAQEA